MTDQDEKVRENRLRRWAKRLGLQLSKSRARTFKVDDRGGWQVLRNGRPIAGADFGLTLDNVETCLANAEALMRSGDDSGVLLEMPDGRTLAMDLSDGEGADDE